MTWAGAKAAIVDVLDGLAITSPVNLTIKRVYDVPPGTVQDWPAFIIDLPEVDNTVMPGMRWRNYRVPLLMIASDQDMTQAAGIVDAFREVLIPAFDAAVSLSGHATMCWVERIDRAGGFFIPPTSTGKLFQGFQAYLHLEIKETVAFS